MKTPVYLDYMATTPVDPRVVEKMLTCMTRSGNFGNAASASHIYGWQAKEVIEVARAQVAGLIKAEPYEIIWTSGATESNNLALKGAAFFYSRRGKHIITSKIEHKSVLDICSFLESQGFEISYIKPGPNGLIELSEIEKAIRPDTILISTLHVNNEIGVIQNIEKIAHLARSRGIIFHVDAAQSAGKIPIDIQSIPVDLMSFSGHKVYGPKGIGALYIRRNPRVRLQPLIHGGGHEQGMRSGTLPTHQIVGMGEAFKIAKQEMHEESLRILELRKRLWSGLSSLEKIYLNGDNEQRISGNLNISFDGVEGESLLVGLKDLAVSSGSACTSATIEPSHVLKSLGISDELAHSSIRFCIGRFTTEEEIDYAINHIKETVTRLRKLSPFWKDEA